MSDFDEGDVRGRPHALYRFWAGETLLYVGITVNVGRRWGRHADDKPWWSEVERVTIEHFPDRLTVLEAETRAIQTEKPKYNIRKTSQQKARKTSTATSSSGPAPLERSDRLTAAVAYPLDPESFVGSFFLGDHENSWQGCVVAEVAPGFYLVETFDWFIGDSYEQRLVSLQDMKRWSFYDTADWMSNAYQHGVGDQWKREREERDGAK